MRLRFVLSEVGIGLRRNLTLTVAAVLTVAVSLALLGVGLLVRQSVSRTQSYYYGKLEVAVYLRADVTQDQRDALRQQIQADPLVKDFTYESQQQAYARFQQQNPSDITSVIGPDALPESFRLQLRDPTQFEVARARYEAQPGVDNVYDYKSVLQPIFDIFTTVKNAAFVVAAIQLVAAVLLIYNTIRVSAFGRRRETGIMRLVGANALSIQLPFLVEGAVAGLVGGAFASAGVLLFKWGVLDRLFRGSAARVFPTATWADARGTLPVLFVVGVGMSVLASFLTLRRFLRV